MTLQKTKHIIVAISLVSVCGSSVAFAEDISITENTSFSARITKQFKDIFNIKDDVKNIEKQEVKDVKIEKSMLKVDTTSPEIKKDSDIKMQKSATSIENLDVTASDTVIEKDISCDEQIKMISKKEKLNKQIINQISDKNKLVESLLAISSSTADKSRKDNFDSKILSLEEGVSLLIKDQRNLSDLLASTTEMLCSKNKKDADKNNIKIKKLEIEIGKKSQNVNNLIKVEIKNLLENVNE